MLSNFYTLLSSLHYPTYPCALPQDCDYPAIAYELISSVPQHTLAGQPTTTISRIQVDIYSDDHAEVDTVATAVRSLLDGHRDTNLMIRRADELENPEQYQDGSDRWVYTRTQDYFVKHSA